MRNSYSLLIVACLMLCCWCQDIKAQSKVTTTYTVPDFYHYLPKYSRDTAYIFRCYDKRDSIIHDVTDYDKVFYYSLFKEYIDSFNTYKDPDGTKHLLPVSYIVRRYDRLGTNRWMTVQYPANKYGELKDDRTTIVRSDTVANSDTIRIFRCYRTAAMQY